MFPNLKNETIIALDIETKDNDIKELGPGYYRAKYGLSDDRILTLAIATQDNVWSFEWNTETRNWLKDNEHLSIIGANTIYDLGWLMVNTDIRFTGRYYDILISESVLCGIEDWYSLDKLARKYLNANKGNDEITEYCEANGWKGDPRGHLYKMVKDPLGLELVLKYNESDARQTYDIFKLQETTPVTELESKNLWMMLEMRKHGIKIDMKKLEKSSIEVGEKVAALQSIVNDIAGFEVKTSSHKHMGKVFDSLGLAYPTTDKGNPSFAKEVLEGFDHPFVNAARDIKTLNKLQTTYLQGFEKYIVNGRVYPEYNPVKNGSRGAVTGRLTANRPGMQTIPSRGIGKSYVRSIFIADDGRILVKQDQSQEELRVFGHFARGTGSKELREAYNEDVNLDMHQFVADWVGIPRSIAKTINFGILYGMGVHKFAVSAGLPVPPPWPTFGCPDYFEKYNAHKEKIIKGYEAAKLFFDYVSKFPCMKVTAKKAEQKCNERGYAKTILNRRRYLNNKNSYKAMNTLIQGTSADIMKLWMVKCYEEGLHNELNFHLTVHDEIVFSMEDTEKGRAAAAEVKRIGETCIDLRVPLKVDHEEGPNWAEVK
jgi:DNA polymerase-1